MAEPVKKQFGFSVRKEHSPLVSLDIRSNASAAFADSDEGESVDTNVAMLSKKSSASTIRIRLQAKKMQEKALAEDPSIFDYDEIYDSLQEKKNEKIAEQKAADKQRKSKYAEQIIDSHKRRLLEQQSCEERKQQKERENEEGAFDDKETFVTGAYRKQMEEMQKFRMQEAMENRMNELTSIEKQKCGMWQSGFYRNLLNDLARNDCFDTKKNTTTTEKESHNNEEQMNVVEKFPSRKHAEKMIQKRSNCMYDDAPNTSTGKNEYFRNSSYSDESDEEPTKDPEQELKPGLNILMCARKKPTKSQQLQSRFTPSNSSSSENEIECYTTNQKGSNARDDTIRHHSLNRGRKTYRNKEKAVTNNKRYSSSSNDDQTEHYEAKSKHEYKSKSCNESRGERKDKSGYERKCIYDEKSTGGKTDRASKKISDVCKVKCGIEKDCRDEIYVKKKLANLKDVKPSVIEERMAVIKSILKKRNAKNEINEFRKRYLERSAINFVTIPI